MRPGGLRFSGCPGWVINVAPVGSRPGGAAGLGTVPVASDPRSCPHPAHGSTGSGAGGAPKPEVGAEPGRDPVPINHGGEEPACPGPGVSPGCPQLQKGGPHQRTPPGRASRSSPRRDSDETEPDSAALPRRGGETGTGDHRGGGKGCPGRARGVPGLSVPAPGPPGSNNRADGAERELIIPLMGG